MQKYTLYTIINGEKIYNNIEAESEEQAIAFLSTEDIQYIIEKNL
jgi:hypothetical protein